MLPCSTRCGVHQQFQPAAIPIPAAPDPPPAGRESEHQRHHPRTHSIQAQ